MPWGIERLRLAIVALGVLLALTIAGSILYGRWRLRHLAQDLPARLGVQIQQSTQGFVLSKSEQGRPLFTLHAARAVEFRAGGHVSLHHVEIDLYSRDSPQPDTIAGEDFEYDPKSQIVQSKGEAHIVLHAPAGNGDAAHPQADTEGSAAGQTVSVTTHDLTFNQKTGVAICGGEVDFQTASASGSAVGAQYDSPQGRLLLESQVVVTAAMRERPGVIHAARATYDRSAEEVHLERPRYTSQGKTGTENGSADDAVLTLRRNGSAERLHATGAVRLISGDGTAVNAPAMLVLLNETNRPQQANFSGGVDFVQMQPGQRTSGTAQTMQIAFTSAGHAKQAKLDGGVHVEATAETGINRMRRTLTSQHLLLHLHATKTGPAEVETAEASGDAQMRSRTETNGRPPTETTLGGQTLDATFAAENQPEHLTALGRTRMETLEANGDLNSSSANRLEVAFAPAPVGKHVGGGKGSDASQRIETAVQTGHVVLRQIPGPGHPQNANAANGEGASTATAERASYRAQDGTLTLTGSPEFHNAQIAMTADRMVMEGAGEKPQDRSAAKMTATGKVQSTLEPGTGGQATGGALLGGRVPAHVIADRATLLHSSREAIFSGHARLWQGDDSVEAPVIEVSQTAQTLVAHGGSGCRQCVTAVFTGAAPTAAAGSAGTARQSVPSPYRVLSAKLEYSEAERKASFTKNVEVIGSTGLLTADAADVFLSDAGTQRTASHATGKDSFPSRNISSPSSVERIVAKGDVRLRQPGRVAAGQRLVYTAEDGRFVLTGTEAAPPTVADVDHGTVSGRVLTFLSAEQEIIVNGSAARAATTKTRVQKN